MTFDEINRNYCPAQFLSDAVPRGNEQFIATCPAHSDSTPSMRIRSYNGKWLAKCFGCSWSGSTVDLVMLICGVNSANAGKLITSGMVTTYVPPKRHQTITGNPVMAITAPDVDVLQWLTKTRHIALSIAEQCYSAGLGRVAFRYPSGWFKVRDIMDKSRQFVSGRFVSELYVVQGAGQERAVITEGECCSMAVRTVCPVASYSVPSGACSRITDNMLAELDRYQRIVVVSDADAPGRALAARWKVALGDRCQVVEIGGFKDSNDALIAGEGKLLRDVIMES